MRDAAALRRRARRDRRAAERAARYCPRPSRKSLHADTFDSEVRQDAPDGTITLVAGSGIPCTTAPGCGDGGPASIADLTQPRGIAVDSAGDIYTADFGDNEIRRVTPGGLISPVAGDGHPCTQGSCRDGGPATSGQLDGPGAVAVDAAGNLYIADSGDDEIRKVDSNGVITRIAGIGTVRSSPPDCGDNCPATNAQLNEPFGVALDAAAAVFIADTGDNEVRAVG